MFGAGAISTTFWCRRCTEQSRSKRCRVLPCSSARICTSMWRGRPTACSMKAVGSPKAPSASRMAALTASRDGLDEDREADLLRAGQQFVQVGRRRGRLEGGQSRGLGGLERSYLVAGQLQHLGGRPDEGNPRIHTGPSQVRIFTQEAVTGIDRVGAGPLRRLDHRLDVEVGPNGMASLADLVRLVGLDPVHCISILVREHRDGLHPELVRRPERADRNLTSVGDQNLGEHALRLSTVCYCPDTGLRSGVVMANRTVTWPDTVWVAGSNSKAAASAMSFAMANVRISRPAGNPVSRSDTSTRSATKAPNAAA